MGEDILERREEERMRGWASDLRQRRREGLADALVAARAPQGRGGARITNRVAGPLFGTEGDQASGTIYVLRSKSDHPDFVAANRDILHKIGVTGGNLAQRLVNAKLDPTFLMADVEIVATYELYNINRSKLEALLHRFFAGARLDLEIADRFGNPVRPREWYLVPLPVIDEVVARIQDGSIVNYEYHPELASLRIQAAQ